MCLFNTADYRHTVRSKGKVHLSFGFDLAEGLPSGFIVDFYCHKADLVVEVDGDIHDLREKTLQELGLRVIRFRNDEVFNSLSSVVNKIKEQTWGRNGRSGT